MNSSRLQVTHVCNIPLPANHPDSTRIPFHPGRWVLNLALAQKRYTDISPNIVMHVPGASAKFATEVEGIPCTFIAAPSKLRSATLFTLDAIRLRKAVLALQPDIVHAHGTEDAYSLAAIATGLPSIITAQGCFFIINQELKPKLLSRDMAVQLTERIALKFSRDVIAKSGYVAAELAREFPHLRLHKIPNTFDPRLLDISRHSEREPLSLAFVGTLVPRKGVHLLRAAIERLSIREKISLHIFGDRPQFAAEYEASEIQKLRVLLGSRLICHGTIPGIEVARAISQCSLLVAPSLEEMFGNQIIESILVGTPVLVADGTAMAENVRTYGGGRIVDATNIDALSQSLEHNLSASLASSEMTDARNRIISKMGPRSVALRHREIYADLLHGKMP